MNELQVKLDRPGGLPQDLASRSLVSRIEASGQEVALSRMNVPFSSPGIRRSAMKRLLEGMGSDEMVEEAAVRIHEGSTDSLREARQILDLVLAREPSHAQALVESAQFVLKTNAGTEGLLQAEQFLRSALRSHAGHANAHVLLGHVHAQQGRFVEADKQFASAQGAASSNLWLWTRWGELKLMQGRYKEARAYLRNAVDQPTGDPSNTPAKLKAYQVLIGLLGERSEFDTLETVHLQRMKEFGQVDCFSAEYAYFLVHVRGAYDKAIEFAKPACALGIGRIATGLAYYAKWAEASDDEQRHSALNLARSHLPSGPQLWRQLAHSDKLVRVAQELLRRRELSLEIQDNQGYTALALALLSREDRVIARLLQWGALAVTQVGPEGIPAGLLPLLTRDLPRIRLLRRHGVDFAQLHHQGRSGIAIAKQIGDPKLVQAVSGVATSI
jgi:tetratricopeptide (TPR) repeat protein